MPHRRTPVQFRQPGGPALSRGMAVAGAVLGGMAGGLAGAAFGALAAGAAGWLTAPTRVHRFRPARGAVLTWIEVLGIPLTQRRVVATFEDVEAVEVAARDGAVAVAVRVEGQGTWTLEAAAEGSAADLRQRADKLRWLVEGRGARESGAPPDVE